jgi:hypothetical protein
MPAQPSISTLMNTFMISFSSGVHSRTCGVRRVR